MENINDLRLIDANALMDAFRSHMVERYDRNKCTLEENCKTCEPGCLWRKKVSAAPTVEAVEVVHSHWISKGYKIECSVCGHRAFLGTHDPVLHTEEKNIRKYCHNCGAKMDGEKNNV